MSKEDECTAAWAKIILSPDHVKKYILLPSDFPSPVGGHVFPIDLPDISMA